ncbi:DUF6972 family protein [Nostoc sp.]
MSPKGSSILLFYTEGKIDAENRYHVTPRTRLNEE